MASSAPAELTHVDRARIEDAHGQFDADVTYLRATQTRVLLDTTQAGGGLPIDAGRFAYTVCGGYKWLLAPRGIAYLTVQADLLDDLVPHTAGWYAGRHPWGTASTGRRCASPVTPAASTSHPPGPPGSAPPPALNLLTGVGTRTLHALALALANQSVPG